MLSLPDLKEKQIIFIILHHGEKMQFLNGNLIVRDYNGKIKTQVTCYRIFCIFIVGSLTITDKLLINAKKFGFSIFFLNSSFKPYGCWNSSSEGNFILREKQYKFNQDYISRFLVFNKISNQLRIIKLLRNKTEEILSVQSILKEYLDDLQKNEYENKTLLSIEGNAAKLYFKILFGEFGFKNRRPRVKADILNLLLDIGYTLLFNLIEAMLAVFGFDLYKGVYHKTFFQRKSLVCDIVEPFRCIIDYRLRKAYKLNQIRIEDFSMVNNAYVLYPKQSKKYISFFMEDLLEEKENIFKFIQNYYRNFMKGNSFEKYDQFKYKETEC